MTACSQSARFENFFFPETRVCDRSWTVRQRNLHARFGDQFGKFKAKPQIN
jgi:hypothetical protein